MDLRLALDIGNSRVKWGVFREDKLVHSSVQDLGELSFSREILENTSHAIAAISGGYNQLDEILPEGIKLIQLNGKLALPLKSDYKTPETIGADRIAAYHGASLMFPGYPVAAVDAGTCITYDIVDGEGVHRGGMISPGLKMRLRAMNEFTAFLPIVDLPSQVDPIALSTADALGQGALCGALKEMEGIIAHCRSRFKGIKIIITGGDADVFEKFLKTEIFAERNLVLIGLHEILKYHVN